MNWRIYFLAVMVLGLFALFSTFYVRHYVRERTHGIILFVCPGAELELLKESRKDAAASDLFLKSFPVLGTLDVAGLNGAAPDAVAALAALATGQKNSNGTLGLEVSGRRTDTLLYAAQRANRTTGLVTTDGLTRPAAAAFYGSLHAPQDPDAAWRNAAELIDSAGVDIVLGGDAKFFGKTAAPEPKIKEAKAAKPGAAGLRPPLRPDKRDLVAQAEENGFAIVENGDALEDVPTWRTRRLLGLFAPGPFGFAGLPAAPAASKPAAPSAPEPPSLSAMVRQAIRCLAYDIRGYFLVVEHGLVEAAARENRTQLALRQLQELDEAIRTAVEYAGPEALVLVTDGVSYGRLPATAEATRSPARWMAGPGMRARPILLPRNADAAARALTAPEPSARYAPLAPATDTPAWIVARGRNCQRFSGFLSNTDLYRILVELF